jgi:hypothetical protein
MVTAPPSVTSPTVSAIDTNFRNGLVLDASAQPESAILFVVCLFPLPGLQMTLNANSPVVGVTQNSYALIQITVDGGGISPGLAATTDRIDVALGGGTNLDHARRIAIGNAWTATSIVRLNGVDCLAECRPGLASPLVPDQLRLVAPLPSSIPRLAYAGARISLPLRPSPGITPTIVSVKRRANAAFPWEDVVKEGCQFALDCEPIATRPDPTDPLRLEMFVGAPWFNTYSSQALADLVGTDLKGCNGGEKAGAICTVQTECFESVTSPTQVGCSPFDAAAIVLGNAITISCEKAVPPSITPLPCVYSNTNGTFSTLIPVSRHGSYEYEVVIRKDISNPYRELGIADPACRTLDGAQRCQLALADIFPASFFSALFLSMFGFRRFSVETPGVTEEVFTFGLQVACINGTTLDNSLDLCVLTPAIAPPTPDPVVVTSVGASVGISQSVVTTATAATISVGVVGIVVIAVQFITWLVAIPVAVATSVGTEPFLRR